MRKTPFTCSSFSPVSSDPPLRCVWKGARLLNVNGIFVYLANTCNLLHAKQCSECVQALLHLIVVSTVSFYDGTEAVKLLRNILKVTANNNSVESIHEASRNYG